MTKKFNCGFAIGLMLAIGAIVYAGTTKANDEELLLVTFSVMGSLHEPIASGEEPEQALLPDGTAIDIPYRHTASRPFSTTLSVTAGATHVGRVITDDHDLYYKLTLGNPKPEGVLAAVTITYTEPSKVRAQAANAGGSLVQVTDSLSASTSVLLPLTGSSTEVGRRESRLGKPPNESFELISVHVTARYGTL